MKPRFTMFVVFAFAILLSACAGGRVVVVPVPSAQGAEISAESATPTEKDLYQPNLREEYYAEVARREAAADLEVKGITEPREIGVTHDKGYVAHVAHTVVTFPDGSSVSIPWMGGENIVRLDNLVGDTIVATFSAYPETGWTLWEYAPGIVPDTEVQAVWPLGNRSHCGLDAGCPMTREWYISWTENGVVFNLVREYKLSAEGELILTDLDPAPFLHGAIAVNASSPVATTPAAEVPAASTAEVAPATEAPAEVCVTEESSFAIGYADPSATQVVLYDESRWIIVGMDPAMLNGVDYSNKVVAVIAPGVQVMVVGLGYSDKGTAHMYACATTAEPDQSKIDAWLKRESNNGERVVESIKF